MTKKDGKPCKQCGTSEWYSGSQCKECQREHARKWRDENQDRASELKKKWAKNNPDKCRESERKWQKNNPGKARERARKWRNNNPGKARERARNWREANPDRHRENKRNWREANPDKRMSYDNNRRTRKTKAGGSFTSAEWNGLCEAYKNMCLKCGKTFPRNKLTADHVVPVSLGGDSNITNIQPLCGSCNSSKGARHIDYRSKTDRVKRWVQRALLDIA